MSVTTPVTVEQSKPISPRQLRANRRNAKRSTGPRSDAGKARSSHNATAHGLFCKELLLPGEDAAALRELRRGIYVSQSPQDLLERELVDRIVAAQWRLRRLPAAERAVLVPGENATPIDTRYRRALERAWRIADKANIFGLFTNHGLDPEAAEKEIDEMVDANRRAGEPPPQPPPGKALAQDFGDCGTRIVDRLSRYRQRLEQSVHRALRELRQLRKDRAEHPDLPPCPYLDELDQADDADDATNSPLSGVATSVAMSSPRDDENENETEDEDEDENEEQDATPDDQTPPRAPRTSNVKNEPISVARHAGNDATDACDRDLENQNGAALAAPLTPTLAGRSWRGTGGD